VHQCTVPPAPERQKKVEAKKDFDPQAFAANLQYTEQVEQLDFTETAAKDFSIGFYRGQVYIPIRHADGSISGFVGYADGQLKLPPKWLPATSWSPFPRRVRKKSPAKSRGFSLPCFKRESTSASGSRPIVGLTALRDDPLTAPSPGGSFF
jgi:hypothetical protein